MGMVPVHTTKYLAYMTPSPLPVTKQSNKQQQ